MRKVFALMLLLSLITTLTGCVDSERYWTLPLEDGFEVWCEDGERMLVRETDWFRYAFVERNIEALRVEDNFILTRGGEKLYLRRDRHRRGRAHGKRRGRLPRRLRGAGAGDGLRVDSAGQPARGGGGRLARPLRRHHAPAAGRGNVRVRGLRGGRTAYAARRPVHEQPRRLPRRRGHLRGTALFPGGRRSRGTPAGGQRLAAAARDRARPLPTWATALPARSAPWTEWAPSCRRRKTAGGALRTRRRATTAISPISSSGCTTRTRRRCTTGNMTPEEGRGCEGCAKGRSSPCCSRSYGC